MEEYSSPNTISDYISIGLCWALTGALLAGIAVFFGVIDVSSTRQPTVDRGPKPVYSTVSRVVDGDTIELSDGTVVRLIGVDAPETKHPTEGVQCHGLQSEAYMKSLLPSGTQVQLEYGVERYDVYGRTLAYVDFAGGDSVQRLLLRYGYARTTVVEPNVKYSKRWEFWQDTAYQEALGLWGQCFGLEPR